MITFGNIFHNIELKIGQKYKKKKKKAIDNNKKNPAPQNQYLNFK